MVLRSGKFGLLFRGYLMTVFECFSGFVYLFSSWNILNENLYKQQKIHRKKREMSYYLTVFLIKWGLK